MNEGESQARKAAPAARRFAADYTNPTSVLRSLAEAYPIKLIGGSDTLVPKLRRAHRPPVCFPPQHLCGGSGLPARATR